MKSVLLIFLSIISFSLGITAFIWEQLALALLFSIIFPVLALYVIMSDRYKNNKEKKEKFSKKEPVDNYFHPV
jgi:predicted membrane protein